MRKMEEICYEKENAGNRFKRNLRFVPCSLRKFRIHDIDSICIISGIREIILSRIDSVRSCLRNIVIRIRGSFQSFIGGCVEGHVIGCVKGFIRRIRHVICRDAGHGKCHDLYRGLSGQGLRG